MQAYDLIMLIVLAMATIFGAIKGFAWQVASLASVVVSYFVAYQFRFEVAEMIQAQPPWNQFLAMLILYVGCSFVIWVGFRLFSGMIDRVRLKEFDRHLGAGFGLFKGVIFCVLITMFATSLLGPNQQAAICQSRSGFYISKALDHGMGILPKEIHDVVGPYLAKLDHKLHHANGTTHPEDSPWPFDGDNVNQQLEQLQIPNGLSELLPVPQNLQNLQNLATGSGGQAFSAGGGQQQQITGLQNPGVQNPGVQNPGVQNPGVQNPGVQNPAAQNPAGRFPLNGQQASGQFPNRQLPTGQYPQGQYPTGQNAGATAGSGIGFSGQTGSFAGGSQPGSATLPPQQSGTQQSGTQQFGTPPSQYGTPYQSNGPQQAQQPSYVMPR